MNPTITPGIPGLAAGSDTGVSATDNLTDLASPTVTGTTVANAVVTLYDTDGTTVLGTATASETGSYSIAINQALDEGSHSLTVKATATGFAASAASAPLMITVDLTAPDAPSAPVVISADDTGVSHLDGVTSDKILVLTGIAEPGSTVQLYGTASTAPLAQVTAADDRTYSITTTALADNTYQFAVMATDAAGNVSKASNASAVTIDTKAPEAPPAPTLSIGSDTGVLHSDGDTSDTTPVVLGTAEAGATVELFDSDGLLLGKAKADDTGAYAITTSVLTSGAHALTVKAVDVAGNVSAASQALNVYIDTARPTATSTLVAALASAGTITFDVVFDEPITTVSAADFTLVATGSAFGVVQSVVKSVTGSATVYAVSVTGLGGAGDVSIAFADGSQITDFAGNPVQLTSSQFHVVANTDTPTTSVVSSSANDTVGTGDAGSSTASGRLVAFQSIDGALVPNGPIGDTQNIYVKDMQTGGISLVSVGTAGLANHTSFFPSISISGTEIAFTSAATNLIPGGTTPGVFNTYVATLALAEPSSGNSVTVVPGSIQLVSTGNGQDGTSIAEEASGLPGTGLEFNPDVDTMIPEKAVLSGSGNAVAFTSDAALVQGAEAGLPNVYLKNLVTGTLTLVSAGPAEGSFDFHDPFFVGTPALGMGGDNASYVTSISADGTEVAFTSASDNLGAATVGAEIPDEVVERSYVYNSVTGLTTVLDANGLTFGGAAGDVTTPAPVAPDAEADLLGTAEPILSNDGTKVTYVVGDGTFGAVFETNLATNVTTEITPLQQDDTPSPSTGGGLVLYTDDDAQSPADPSGLFTEPSGPLSLFDTKTQTTTPLLDDGGNDVSGDLAQLTPDGNAVTFGSLFSSFEQTTLFETTLGVTVGVDTIGARDEIGSAAVSLAVANGGLAISGTTNAPIGSTVLVQLFSAQLGIYFARISGSVTTAGRWSAMISAQSLQMPDGAYFAVVQIGTPTGISIQQARQYTIDTVAPATPDAPKLDAGSDTSLAHDGSITNQDTPVVTGTTEAGATVTLYDLDFLNVLGTAVADNQGVYTITTDPLNQGLDHLGVKATDAAGNVSATSAALAVTVDSVAPNQTSAPTLASGSDTGVSASDGVTSNATPTVTGIAEPGSHVTLYDTDGISVLGTAVAAAHNGLFSISSSNLGDGSHSLTVTATDNAGNVSPVSAPLVVTIDTEPPVTPAITSVEGPTTNDGKLAPLIDVIGTAEPGATVTLHLDGDDASSGQATVGQDGSYDIASDTLPGGGHKLTVIATDTAGNDSQPSLPNSVTVGAAVGPPPGLPPNTPFVSGIGEDGYIVGATVFGDANGNGVLDPGEVSTVTGSGGAFTLYATGEPFVLTGGVDSSTGLTLPGNLTAPAASFVISPFTTFLDAYLTVTGGTIEQESLAAAAALGPAANDSDFLVLDPVENSASGDVAPAIISAKLIDTAVDLAAVIGGAGGSEETAFQAVFEAIAEAVAGSPNPFDFDSASGLSVVLLSAAADADPSLTLSNTIVNAAGQIVAAGNTALDSQLGSSGGSAFLSYIDAAELVAQGALAPALSAAAANPGLAAGVSSKYTGAALTAAILADENLVLQAPQVAPASDGGRSQDDNVTDDTTPILTGMALPGATVVLAVLESGEFFSGTQLFEDSTVIGIGTADATGHYSIQVTPLDSLEQRIFATLASPTVPPQLGSTIGFPLSGVIPTVGVGVHFVNDDTPEFISVSDEAGSGNDATHSSLLVYGSFTGEFGGGIINVYADGGSTPIGTGFTAVDDSFGIETSALANGPHTLTVTATTIGGTIIQGDRSFTTVVTAPAVYDGQASASEPLVDATVSYGALGGNDGNSPVLFSNVGTLSDGTGEYALPIVTNSLNITVTGGLDPLTGSVFQPSYPSSPFSLLAPTGSAAVTPLTTLVAFMPYIGEQPATLADIAQSNAIAAQEILTGLGLPTDLDLLSLDPLAEALAGDTAPFLAAAKLTDTAALFAAVTEGSGFQEAFTAIARFIVNNGTIDLDSTADISAVLTAVLGNGFALSPDDLQAVSKLIADSNAVIDSHAQNATSLGDVLSYTLALEKVTQGAEATALDEATYNENENQGRPGFQDEFQNVEQPFIGADLDAAVATALGQSAQVTSFTPSGAGTTGAASVDYIIAFSQPVTGVVASDFSVVAGGDLLGAHVTGVTPEPGSGGSTYDVAVQTGIGQGALALDFSGVGILNANGLPLASGVFESTPFASESVTGRASGVVIGDFNGDGKPDVLMANSDDSGLNEGLVLFLNQGDGVFTPQGEIAAGDSSAAAVGDFNGDGKLDAVTTYNTNSLSVLLGNGDGTFQSPIIVATGGGIGSGTPSGVAVGDFNHDGKLDLVSTGTAGISVLLGNGDGTFLAAQTLSMPTAASAVAVADLNGDGNLDIVATSSFGNQVAIFLSNGDGTFTPDPQSTSSDHEGVAIGDLNGDGIPDLVVAVHGPTGSGDTSNSLSILLGNGDGAFTAAAPFVFPIVDDRTFEPSSIAIGDVNNDGKTDIVATGAGGTVVLLGNGDGTFEEGYQNSMGETAWTQSVALADLNGDGLTDIVGSAYGQSTNLLGDGITVFLNLPQPVLDSTSAPVTIDRPGLAAPEILQVDGPGSLTRNGNNYTLNLGQLLQGQILNPLQFALSNTAFGTVDAFEGSFDPPTGNGFTVDANNLTVPLAAGNSLQNLTYTTNVNSIGVHSETITFAPLDVGSGGGTTETLGTGLDLDSDLATAPAPGITTAGELPALTLTVTDDIVASVNNPAVAQLVQFSGGGNWSQIGNDYTLDLGTPAQGSFPQIIDIAVSNAAEGPADLLSGTFQLTGSSAFTASGFNNFNGLEGQSRAGIGLITLDTGATGLFTETITFDPIDTDLSGDSSPLPEQVLTITADVEGTGLTIDPIDNGVIDARATAVGVPITGTVLGLSPGATFQVDVTDGAFSNTYSATVNLDGSTWLATIPPADVSQMPDGMATVTVQVNAAQAQRTVGVEIVPTESTVTLTVQTPGGIDLSWPTLYQELANSSIAGGTGTGFTATDTDNNASSHFVVTGTGLTYGGNSPDIQLTGGLITGIEVLDASDNVLAAYSNFLISAVALQAGLNTYMAAFQGDGTADLSELNTIFLADQYQETGGAGIDHLQGGNLVDLFHASAGNDVIDGGAGINVGDYSPLQTSGIVANIFDGGGTVSKGGALGIDTVTGLRTLIGSTGDDVFYIDAGETVSGGGGFDYLIELTPGVNLSYGTNFTGISEFVSNVGDNTVSFANDPNVAYVYGSIGNDVLTLGTGGGDLFGEGGANVLNGGANATNLMIGGDGGTDTMNGGGGSASNFYYVDGNSDQVDGAGAFNVVTELTPGVTVQVGSAQYQDVQEVIFDSGTNQLSVAAADSDFIYVYGGSGNDTLTLGSGGGYLLGGAGTNTLNGSGSDSTDIFIADDPSGIDTMNGGAGVNIYYVNNNSVVQGAGTFNLVFALTNVNVQLGSAQYHGVQEIVLSGGSNTVGVAAGDSDLVFLDGGAGNDTLTAGTGGGYLFGGGGVNTLNGGGSTNVFVADALAGVDTMNGGSGSNVYYIDSHSAVHGAGTFNTVLELDQNASLAYGSAQLGTDIQEVVLNSGTNTADFSADPNAIYLYGGAGNDTLFGGTGNDFLFGGAGTNTFAFKSGWGLDTIMDWTAGTSNQIDLTALSAQGVHGITDLTQTIVNGSDVITSGHTGTNSITLNGFNSTLTASSLHFV